MFGLFLAATAATFFNDYPVFVDRTAQVEAVFDKGTIVELLVKCHSGTAIVVMSPLEKKYCASDMSCHATLDVAIEKSCR